MIKTRTNGICKKQTIILYAWVNTCTNFASGKKFAGWERGSLTSIWLLVLKSGIQADFSDIILCFSLKTARFPYFVATGDLVCWCNVVIGCRMSCLLLDCLLALEWSAVRFGRLQRLLQSICQLKRTARPRKRSRCCSFTDSAVTASIPIPLQKKMSARLSLAATGIALSISDFPLFHSRREFWPGDSFQYKIRSLRKGHSDLSNSNLLAIGKAESSQKLTSIRH